MAEKFTVNHKFLDFRKNGVTVFNKLTVTTPIDDITTLSTIVDVECECGQEGKFNLRQVVDGKRTSCGNCSCNEFKKEKKVKFGKLTLITPIENIRMFNQKVDVVCECGNTGSVLYRNLATNNTKSCGKCELTTFKNNNITKFGCMTLTTPINSVTSLSGKYDFLCVCGSVTKHRLYNVISGHTSRCGECHGSLSKKYRSCGEKDFTFPIEPGVLFDLIVVKNTIFKLKTKMDAECPLCGGPWTPLFQDVVRCQSVSCGCSYTRISSQQMEIADYIKSLGFDVTVEYSVDGRKYDIFVPHSNLLIEYHGLKWHVNRKKDDQNKHTTAVKNGYKYLAIFEDEWRDKKHIFMGIIREKVMATGSFKLRPKQCSITTIDNKQAAEFHEKFHYIGKTNGKVNYGVIYEGQIIAVASFSKPTRQTSRHQWELTRMSSNPRYKVHGIWSKIMGLFINEHDPCTIVSFSDNRLFSGDVYNKIGFTFDGKVKADYYWSKNRHRYHKSGLRKTKLETRVSPDVSESVLRESQGYGKIWDVGKIRWVISRSSLSVKLTGDGPT
jgi:hypothetical protein